MIPRQFDAQAERSYYKNSPNNWEMACGESVETIICCTAGADWVKYLRDKDVLEIGAGECTYVPHLLVEGRPLSYLAGDIFEDLYAPACKDLASSFKNLEFRTLHADNIEMPDSAFDTILAFGVYHRLTDLLGRILPEIWTRQ